MFLLILSPCTIPKVFVLSKRGWECVVILLTCLADVSPADMLVSQATSWPNGFIIFGFVISVMRPDRLTAEFL